jgi:uncharacterized protein YecE (DUF72 family)
MITKPKATQSLLFPPQPEEEPAITVPRVSAYQGIRFGTSTWAYPGWTGIVYSRKHKTSSDYLREYVKDPRFQTVGADFTFYTPPSVELLRSWLEFLPADFSMVFKVWDELTVDRFEKVDQVQSPKRMQGTANPNYLSVSLFEDAFLAPFVESGFKNHIAGLLFEFRSSTARNPDRFLTLLETFLQGLPKDFPYAVEVRDPKLLGKRYTSILRASHTTHVINHWDRMPSIAQQMEQDVLTGDRVISRILTPLRMPYAVAKRKFAPYNRLDPSNILHQMRRDVLQLCQETINQRLPGYILVNNRSEGCAPMTIQALEEAFGTSPQFK